MKRLISVFGLVLAVAIRRWASRCRWPTFWWTAACPRKTSTRSATLAAGDRSGAMWPTVKSIRRTRVLLRAYPRTGNRVNAYEFM